MSEETDRARYSDMRMIHECPLDLDVRIGDTEHGVRSTPYLLSSTFSWLRSLGREFQSSLPVFSPSLLLLPSLSLSLGRKE